MRNSLRPKIFILIAHTRTNRGVVANEWSQRIKAIQGEIPRLHWPSVAKIRYVLSLSVNRT